MHCSKESVERIASHAHTRVDVPVRPIELIPAIVPYSAAKVMEADEYDESLGTLTITILYLLMPIQNISVHVK